MRVTREERDAMELQIAQKADSLMELVRAFYLIDDDHYRRAKYVIEAYERIERCNPYELTGFVCLFFGNCGFLMINTREQPSTVESKRIREEISECISDFEETAEEMVISMEFPSLHSIESITSATVAIIEASDHDACVLEGEGRLAYDREEVDVNELLIDHFCIRTGIVSPHRQAELNKLQCRECGDKHYPYARE